MARRTPSLIHRGYLYAQKRPMAENAHEDNCLNSGERTRRRMTVAEGWKQGYLQARRDAKKGQ